nr:MAG: hypothetical protein CM15mP61_05230 [Gammaproteobacteria bacterium]
MVINLLLTWLALYVIAYATTFIFKGIEPKKRWWLSLQLSFLGFLVSVIWYNFFKVLFQNKKVTLEPLLHRIRLAKDSVPISVFPDEIEYLHKESEVNNTSNPIDLSCFFRYELMSGSLSNMFQVTERTGT